ncbi:putative chromatin regulator PHD family [Arabidopsis thaliana]
MDVVGEFQKGEIDGKPCLLYQNVIKPQIHSPNPSDEKHLIQNPLPIQNMTKVAIDSGDNLPPPPLLYALHYDSIYQQRSKLNYWKMYLQYPKGRHILLFSICDFVAHIDCIHNPQTIRISRHFHRVSFTFSLPSGKWCCGICRREIDSDYGAYSCNVCKDYAVHTRCALRKDIWDGIELEGVPEDKDVEPPFYRIADGIILHFSHGCHMKFETNGVYKENEFCQACVLPINEENFYVCVKCDFILHEKCADAPRKKVHPLHPHPIEQKVVHENHEFECAACMRKSSGFGYVCTINGCDYELDAVCASASEPFNYQVHPHPLFLALDPKKRQYATFASQQEFKRYKHDEHYLTFCRGDEASGSDWCELCEGSLVVGGEKGFYKCNECCTTLHINCLLGPDPYLKPGLTFPLCGGEILFQRNNSASRPICHKCNIRCPYPTVLEYRLEMSSTFLCCIFHL